MLSSDLQSLCELGQRQLMEMQYLAAETTLARAEAEAWALRDFDTLSRLYMPLQETRRQRRQRCGEGTVRLDLLATGPSDDLDPQHILAEYPQGQLLAAGWGSIAPALHLRKLQSQKALFVDTFLAAAYPIIGGSHAVVIVPSESVSLPPPTEQRIDTLLAQLPPHCIILHENELPHGPRLGTYETYGEVMAIWERLHAPFLAAADMQVDPLLKIEHYRRTIDVDYACELAHQKLADVAKELARKQLSS
jgi:hypothetical protein